MTDDEPKARIRLALKKMLPAIDDARRVSEELLKGPGSTSEAAFSATQRQINEVLQFMPPTLMALLVAIDELDATRNSEALEKIAIALEMQAVSRRRAD
jgi:hypothetical protein